MIDPLMLTVTVVVFVSAIFLLFSQEVTRFSQKIFASFSMQLLLPLIIVSWIIEAYENWGRWLFVWLRAEFNHSLKIISELLPFHFGALDLIRIGVLFLVATFLILCCWMMKRYTGLYSALRVVSYIVILIWIILLVLMIAEPL